MYVRMYVCLEGVNNIFLCLSGNPNARISSDLFTKLVMLMLEKTGKYTNVPWEPLHCWFFNTTCWKRVGSTKRLCSLPFHVALSAENLLVMPPVYPYRAVEFLHSFLTKISTLWNSRFLNSDVRENRLLSKWTAKMQKKSCSFTHTKCLNRLNGL